jgi:hypothetical protein
MVCPSGVAGDGSRTLLLGLQLLIGRTVTCSGLAGRVFGCVVKELRAYLVSVSVVNDQRYDLDNVACSVSDPHSLRACPCEEEMRTKNEAMAPI